MPHISIKAEPVFEIGHFIVTNSLLASLVVTVLFVFLGMYYSSQVQKADKSRFFYLIHGLIAFVYDVLSSVLKDKVQYFFPLLGASFLFIFLNNWFGLLPGVGSVLIKIEEHGESVFSPLLRAGTADLNMTIALALMSVILTQYFGFKYLGAKAHLMKYASPIGVMEGITEVARILSFSFRLFGNIFAGETVLLIMSTWWISSPFFLLEVFVGFIQAIVFTMLTAVFISLALTKHH